MIEIAFTQSDYYLSKLIREVTGEEVSHCILIINNTSVVHSNFLGVHEEDIDSFLTHSKIIYRLPLLTLTLPQVIEILDKYKHTWYDFGALLFLGLSLYLRKYFPKIIPKQNLWQASGMFLCTEFVTQVIYGETDSLITPYQLYLKLSKSVPSTI